MEYKAKYTPQEVRENLSQDELEEIEDKVLKLVHDIWDGAAPGMYFPTHYDYCSFCQDECRIKTRVICNAMDLSCECASCFAKRREQQFIDEAIDRKKNVRNPGKPESAKSTVVEEKQINIYKPSFDLDDFIRI